MNANPCTWPAVALVLIVATSAARAQTIFVDTSSDLIDFGGAQQVADLPGPDGKVSLPEAGLASDNTPGVQTIGFHIPQRDWQYQQFFPGRAVLRPFLGFRVFDTVILDATTQTAFTGDTNPNGGEVVIWAETYLINNVGGRMSGFDNSGIHLSGGSGNVIQANTVCNIEVFDSSSNLIGGTSPGQGNTQGFVIQIDRASDNVVVGNTVSRLRVLGWIGNGQAAANNRVGGPTPGERNYITGFGTLNSQGIPAGFAVQLFDSIGTVIENNQIGTTPDGMQRGHLYNTAGIYLDGENHGTMIRNNRIAGILARAVPPHGPGYDVGTAIVVYGTGSGVTITGNKIGLDAIGQPVLGSVTGIGTTNYYLGPVTNVVIGGSAPGEGNEIAGHRSTGISIANTFAGVRIAGNSIHDNGGIGIDLITDGFLTGVTPNDPLDVDSGGNGLQNFPVLQSATRVGNSLRIVGTLNSSPSSTCALEFFASPQCDSSGFGEGQQFLGSTSLTTDALGNAAFDVTLAVPVQPGWFVSSTATAAASLSTSEFSACVTVSGSPFQWGNLGQGLAGTNRVPPLAGTGSLTADMTVTWSLTGALAATPAVFIIGARQIRFPFAGGMLVPAPDFVLAGSTDAAGAASRTVLLTQGLPAGQEISVQVWLLDPVGPFGLAASNAIAATAR